MNGRQIGCLSKVVLCLGGTHETLQIRVVKYVTEENRRLKILFYVFLVGQFKVS